MKENKIEQLTDIEHAIKRPSIYIGSVVPTKCSTFVLDKNSEKFSYEEIEYVPGFLKIIYEVLDNAIDEAIRTRYKFADQISIDIDLSTSKITIADNGRGIPLKNMEGTDKSQLEIALTSLRAGSNFNDDEGRILLGMNGVGASLTNIFSKSFTAEVYDGEKYGLLSCKNNLSEKSCEIKNAKRKKTGTTISFIPDLKKFGLKKITDIYVNLIHQRLMFLSITYPEIKFKFNNEIIKFKNSKNFMNCFSEKYVTVQDENYPSKYLIGVIPNEFDEFTNKSYINGADCVLGGNHLDVIHSELVSRIKEKLSKKYKNIKVGDIKNRLSYIINFREFPNPLFNSQTKESFSSAAIDIKTFLKDIDWDEFASKICKCKEIIDPIIESFKIKEELQSKKTLDKISKSNSKFKCKKYLPAIDKNEYFAICEGDCLDKETKIFNLSENCEMEIKDLKIGDLVLTHKQRIKPVVNKSEKLTKCFKIKTKTGKEIICSENHRFYVYDTVTNTFKWKKLKDIKKETDKLIFNKLAKGLALEKINIEKNDDKKYKLKIFGEHFQFLSTLEHRFLVFNVKDERFEMKTGKNIDSELHMMVLIKED